MMLCSSGFYIAFYISLQSIKHTQQQIILSSDLKNKFLFEFSFSKNDLKNNSQGFSFEEKNEINYKEKMYDIISQHAKGDSFLIKCIADENEDYTLALAQNQNVKAQSEKNSKELSIIQFRLGTYTFNANNNFSKIDDIISLQLFARFNPGNLLSPYLNIPSPPPWLLV